MLNQLVIKEVLIDKNNKTIIYSKSHVNFKIAYSSYLSLSKVRLL